MKKQTVLALALLLLIPVVMILGGMLSSLINPEIAAGHPNYSRNFHILTIVKHLTFFVPLVIGVILWFFVCFLCFGPRSNPLCGCFLRPWGRSAWPFWKH